jgi:hypothetical protein
MRLLAMLAWSCCAPLAQAADFNVTTLFASLAKSRPTKAEFVEKKYLALLDRPVESRGELLFTPPARMEKRTLAPKPETVVVDADRVSLERAGKRYTMGLRENPAIAVLVESIRATLGGDLASLTRTYSVALDGTAGAWKLKLRPLDPTVATLVERIDIAGGNAEVRSVEIFQADGDRSVMTITPAKG